MYPILYKADETNFSHMGIGILIDTISCVVIESRNGSYELTLTYPINGKRSNDFDYNTIIKAKANDEFGDQLFRVYHINYDRIAKKITIKAQHITYDLADNFIDVMVVSDLTCTEAGNLLLNSCAYPTPFVFTLSDITHISSYSIERVSPLEAIFGTTNSLLYAYGNGATVVRNNFRITLMQNKDAAMPLIAYKKNMIGFTRLVEGSSVITGIYPYATVEDSEGSRSIITLPEKYIYSDYVDLYPYPKITSVDLSGDDVSSIGDLRKKAITYLEGKSATPDITYTIEFMSSSKTIEYKNINIPQEQLYIGGKVLIIDHELGLRIETKIIKIEYDTITERIISIELGSKRDNLANSVTNTNSMLVSISDRINQTTQKLSNLESHVYYPNQIYNSNFERIKPDNTPDYWDTTGNLSTLDYLLGSNSLRLSSGEYAQNIRPVQAFKWQDRSTSFSFRVIGNGKIKVQVLADGIPQTIYTYSDDTYVSNTEFISIINSNNWFDSKRSVELQSSDKAVVLYIECTEGEVFVDCVQANPISVQSRVDVQYTDGPMCENDTMSIRQDDLLNAKIGDMWFRSDL